MKIDTFGALTAQKLRAEREKAKREHDISFRHFSQLMGLRNHESLWRYEKGKRPISRKLAKRFWEWTTGQHEATIVATIEIPEGTLLPDNATIAICDGCARKFIRLNRRRRFHSRLCQLRTWRSFKQHH